MRWSTPGAVALLTGAALVVLAARRPAAEPPDWEPAESAAWSDPAAAQLARDLDARRVETLGRSEAKVALAEGLLRGEVTLAEAAGQFRAVNAGAPSPYGPLRDCYPGATEEELSYHQAVRFVRGLARVHPAAVDARLPGLEAEVARRFPPNPSKAPAVAG